MPRLAAACTCLVLALGPAARAQAPDVVVHGPAKAAAELVATERAFAARSREAGAKAAFAEFMDAADSRAFTGGDPVRGAVAIGADHAGPGVLDWQPREVFASKSGDMGVVWGVFQFTPPSAGARVTGRYVTAWRKDAKAGWRGIIDIGTPDQRTAAGN